MRPPLALLALPLFALPAAAQQSWVVDPGPGGDFDSIQEANDSPAVTDGDLLLVHPGASSYGATTLTKALRLVGVGATRPEVLQLVATNVGGFAASNLQFDSVFLQFVPGAVHLDRCLVGRPDGAPQHLTQALYLANTPNALISRTLVHPAPWHFGGTTGLRAVSAKVRIVDSEIRGGCAFGDEILGGNGGLAVSLLFTDLWTAGTSLIGGDGQHSPNDAGQSGSALVFQSSNVDIRGSAHDVVRVGWTDPSDPTVSGMAIDKVGSGAQQARVSGATVIGFSDHAPHPAVMPYLALEGPLQPGAVVHANLYGEAGAFALWVASLLPADVVVPTITHGHLWLDVGAQIHMDAFLLSGLDAPVGVPLLQPNDSALAGIAVHLGGFQWSPDGTWIATPATALVLGG